MKYLCLVYLEEKILNGFPSHERRAISDEALSYCEKLQKAGQLLAASPLHPVETATTAFMARQGMTPCLAKAARINCLALMGTTPCLVAPGTTRCAGVMAPIN